MHSPKFWSMNGACTVGTVHLRIHKDAREQDILRQVVRLFKDAGLPNVTVQVEKDGGAVPVPSQSTAQIVD